MSRYLIIGREKYSGVDIRSCQVSEENIKPSNVAGKFNEQTSRLAKISQKYVLSMYFIWGMILDTEVVLIALSIPNQCNMSRLQSP